MRTFLAICPFLLLSDLARAEGVVVGHPVDFRIAAGTGLTFNSLSMAVTSMTVDFCGGSPHTYDVNTTFHIGDEILLPVGEICGVDLNLTGTTVISGVGTAGGTFELDIQLSVVQIEVDPSVTVASTGSSSADSIELAQPNWVTASALALSTGVNRVVTSSSTEHPSLRSSVRNASTILE